MRQYFVDKGIDPTRMTFIGYGELRPVAANDTAEGRARNRRVEIHLVQ
ncbi:MAG TPA: OmpA family protein [Bacteroidales bacterium]|nr:OmpA family protein [Bacteroidales bacterium]